MVAYFAFTFFFPYTTEGNLIFLVLLQLLITIVSPSPSSRRLLLATGIIVFLNLFYFHGTNGYVPFKSSYAGMFYYVFFGYFALLTYTVLNNFSGKHFLKGGGALAVGAVAVANLYFFGAPGTSDTVAWSIIFRDTIGRGLFEAHAITDNIYPPFSTFIMSFFANTWKNIVGPSKDYAMAVKSSILSFYLLGIASFVKFSRLALSKLRLSALAAILTFLTTISLAMNSLSLTYVDFYVVPLFVLSFYAIYHKRFFLAGLFLAMASLTKWQPTVLAPLFAVAIFDIRDDIKKVFSNSSKFVLGFMAKSIGV